MSKKTIIVVLVLLVVLAAIGKLAKSPQRSEWHGLTESEARSKLDAKLPGKIPNDKRTMISDKMVGKMRERGVIVEDPTAADDAAEPAAEAEQPAS